MNSIIKLSILLILICSCDERDEGLWEIPLKSTSSQIVIQLPPEFTHMKESLHLSDCKPCGQQHTVISDKILIDAVDDTTGFWIPWLSDLQESPIFYVVEQRYPETYSNKDLSFYGKEKEKMVSNFKKFEKHGTLLKSFSDDHLAYIAFEKTPPNYFHTKEIECRFYHDSKYIRLYFIQYEDLSNDLLDKVCESIEQMELEEI